MAKLEGVKVLDMVGGEITKVAYDGAEYVKVDDVKEPIDGDIALNNKESESYTEGAFYELRAGLSKFGNFITKSDNDGAGYNGKNPKFWTVFRKVSASKPTIDERVDSLEKRVDALEEKPEPAQLFKKGDIVVITGKGDIGEFNTHHFEIGELVRVQIVPVNTEADDRFLGESLKTETAWYVHNSYARHATQAEREQYEEALKPKEPKLKAGDWVTIDTRRYNLDITEGKAYEVLGDAGDLYFLDDAGDKRTGWFRDEAYEIVEEPSVFERIGRKEGEFKVGDVVRVIGDGLLCGENKDGDIGVVTSFNRWTGSPQVRVSGRDCGNDGNGWFAPAHYFELIAPVESRVDAN